jgi:hypothetical protein
MYYSIDDFQYCPVCGYALDFEPWHGHSPSDEICPCCGIQFGYDDAAGGDVQIRQKIYEQWRQRWIEKGMPWDSAGIEDPPPGWDPQAQLKQLTCRGQ